MTHCILVLFSATFSVLPRKINLFIGRLIGILLYLFPFRKNVAKKNIDIVFKDLSSNDKKLILLNCYKHYGMVLIDFLCQQSINKYNLDEYFIFSNEAKKTLLTAGGGCILSAHIGNWEMVLPAMGLNEIKMDTVVMEQKNKAANNFYTKLRTFKNINLIFKHGALKSLYTAIEENRMIGLASDQNARRKGIKIDFFGEPSSFPKGAGKFYYKTNYTEEIKINSNDDTENSIIKLIVSTYANILSKKIKQHPEQYFWFHKKWSKIIYKQ